MAGWIEASVSVLRCEEGHTTRYLTFHSDTDMVTAGLASLSSVSKDEIVVSELEPTEFTDETGLAFQSRMNQSLGRHDLRFVRLRRVESNESPEGVTFQDFRQQYSQPILIFACPQCDCDAVSVRDETLSNYERSGGKLTVLLDRELR